MPSLPSASTTVSDASTTVVGGTDVCCVIAPVATSDDATPRFFGSAKAVYDQHGYCDGVEYVAHHVDMTGLPVVFVGVPIATAGAISAEVTDGNTNTCVTTVTAGGDGVLAEHDGVLKVVTGGTIGTDQIVLSLSLDGGRTFRTVRLGTGNSYALPYHGATIAFAAGDLTAGETIHTWHGSGPAADADGFDDAFAALASQLRFFRSIVVIGDIASSTIAAALLADVNAYKSANDRATFVRANVYDRASDDTKAEWMAEIDAEFESIDAAPRMSLGAGRGRRVSPFSGWYFRCPVAWADSIRSYQHDLHVAPWRKSDGPTGWDLFDADGDLAEWDDRVDGSAGSAARFTTFRTWSNGPAGAFIALSLTRAEDDSILLYTHNQAVTDLVTNTAQLATEEAVGRSLVLKADGTATEDALRTIEAEVNSALTLAIAARDEGQRASSAVWSAARDDVLNVPEATLNGTLTLNLNGTIHTVNTTIKVS